MHKGKVYEESAPLKLSKLNRPNIYQTECIMYMIEAQTQFDKNAELGG